MAWVMTEKALRSAEKIWYYYHQRKTQIPLFDVIKGQTATEYHKHIQEEFEKNKGWSKEAVKKRLRDKIEEKCHYKPRKEADKIQQYTFE